MKLTVKLGMMVAEGCKVQMTNNEGVGQVVADEPLGEVGRFQMWREGVGRVVSCEPLAEEGWYQAILEVPDEWAPMLQDTPFVSVGEKVGP